MELVVPEFTAEPWNSDPGKWAIGPSPHLSWSELQCKDSHRTPYPTEWRVSRAHPLALEFEIVRATLAGSLGRERSIKIGSGYRTAGHNRDVGGSRNSMHVEGRAIDLWTPSGVGLLDFLDIVILVARRPGSRIRGIGTYPWGVHIDIREGDRIARWKGGRVSPEVVKRIMNV